MPKRDPPHPGRQAASPPGRSTRSGWATLATVISISLAVIPPSVQARPKLTPMPRTPPRAAPSQILEVCRETPFTTDPKAIAIRKRVNAVLNAPINPKVREALNRGLAKTEQRAGRLRVLKRITGIDRDQRSLSLLARAHRMVQDERLAASYTTTEGDHEGVRVLFVQRFPEAKRLAALSADRLMELANIYDNVMSRTRVQAATNWKDADLMVRRWAARGNDLTLERIMRINSVLGSGMPQHVTKPGLIRYSPSTSLVMIVDGRRMSFLASSDVPRSMAKFMDWYATAKGTYGPIELAARTAHRLVSIHPFADGNGRTARLVADWILQRHGLPPATLSKRNNILAVFGEGAEASEKVKVVGAIEAVAKGVQHTLEIYASQLGRDKL